MKPIFYARRLVAFVAMVMAVYALSMLALAQQVMTNVAPANPIPGVPADLPGIWTLVIAAVTPFIIQGVKLLLPKLPKWALPSLTPAVGVAIGLLLNWLASKNLGWIDMAQAGALAVFLREVFDQAITKALLAPADKDPELPDDSG